MKSDAARRIAERFPTRFLRSYARSKIANDPIYEAAAAHLRGQSQPLFDLGCGIGLLPFYLRELGMGFPVVGIDHDESKIAVARGIAAQDGGMEFRTGDAREPVPPGMNVAAIDVLHYFSDDDQSCIVENIAGAIPEGGMALFRDCVRDGTLRYRLTFLQESFSRLIGWLAADRLNFATRETIVRPFQERGFRIDVQPLWGRTPFNNYLFVFRRP